jgi:predicted short-subunit dehydrogenase-like oxidoreductase (DUF2520 family)
VPQIRPDVAIVGAGAVAQALGHLLAAGGEPVVALASRTRERAEQAARFIGAGRASGAPVQVVSVAELPRLASRVLIAVSDRAVEQVAAELVTGGMRSGAALHTCGAKGPDALNALRNAGVACGVLHPLQTIVTPEQGVASLAGATFGMSGDAEALEWGGEIARLVGGPHGRSIRIDADRLSYYHAGAVMASNALVAVMDAAILLLAQAGIERDDALRALAPLAQTSLGNALRSGPEAALTGPVVRGDAATVAAHLHAVRHSGPTVAGLYKAAAAHLLLLAERRGLPEASVRALEEALAIQSGERPGEVDGH